MVSKSVICAVGLAICVGGFLSDYFGSIVALLVACIAGVVVILFSSVQRSKGTSLPFKNYNPPAFPTMFHVLANLPKSWRIFIAAEMQAPKDTVQDERDLEGGSASVYSYEEVVPGKLWIVSYSYQGRSVKLAKAAEARFTSAESKRTLKNTPESMKKMLEKDVKKWDKCFNELSLESGASGWWLKNGLVDSQNCIVAKLPSGKVLLYGPVKVHPDLAEFLAKVGEVEYIVIGSNDNVLIGREAAEKYPKARIIGSEIAEARLKAVGVRSFAYKTTDPHELAAVNALLAPEGACVHSLDGSALDEVLVTVHRQLLECDLLVVHCDADRLIVDRRAWESDPALFAQRIFYYNAILVESPNGFTPHNRCQFMDTESPLPLVCGMTPTAQSRAQMAASLREILARNDWDQCLGVMFGKVRAKLSREEFARTVQSAWGWLDESKKLAA